MDVSTACKLLSARRQGFYEWQRRQDNYRAIQDQLLTTQIKNIFYESKQIYGARRIVALLGQRGIYTSRRRVRRLMTLAKLIPVTFKRRMNTTVVDPKLEPFPNLLMQDFKADAPNTKWVSDFTYVPTDEGWLYLCSIVDLFHRGVVGWAVSDRIDRNLAIAAFDKAVSYRHPKAGFIFHTDRGCQFASSDFRNAVANAGGIQSMSRPGTPYDNACAESFFKTLKTECLDRFHFRTRHEAEHQILQYMLFYNRIRIHQSLGYLSPVQFEALHSVA